MLRQFLHNGISQANAAAATATPLGSGDLLNEKFLGYILFVTQSAIVYEVHNTRVIQSRM